MACKTSNLQSGDAICTATKSLGKTLLEAHARQGEAVKSTAKREELAGNHISAGYKVHSDLLGSGGSATVLTATCRSSGHLVAVKRCKLAGVEAAAKQKLREEVRLHSTLDHPGIVELLASFEEPTSICLVMELLEGGELLDRVNDQGQFSEEAAVQVVLQILRTLAYLHCRHVVHRDIKLENLMYKCNDSTIVKLIDFGLAIQRHPDEKLTERCGTPQYVAPEVLLGEPYDERADMWSLGIVVYAMLTGKALFEDERDIAQQLRRGRLDCSSKFKRLSRRAQDFILSLLSFEPECRPAAHQALAHPWLRCMAPEETAQTLHLVAEENEDICPALVSSPQRTKVLLVALVGFSFFAIGRMSLQRSVVNAAA